MATRQLGQPDCGEGRSEADGRDDAAGNVAPLGHRHALAALLAQDVDLTRLHVGVGDASRIVRIATFDGIDQLAVGPQRGEAQVPIGEGVPRFGPFGPRRLLGRPRA